MVPTQWIEKIIRIDSVTHKSNAEIVDFLIPLLESAGLKVKVQTVSEGGEVFKNLIAVSHSLDAKDLLVFNTHLDTVSPGEKKLWTKTDADPYRATFVKNRVYGLGTADVKLDFLCKILAAKQIGKFQKPIALVGTFGEERGLVGVSKLFSLKGFRPKYALVGEPSNLELIYAHKGQIVYTAAFAVENSSPGSSTTKRWNGKAAHSSTPHLGRNALSLGLKEIQKRQLGIASLLAGTNANKIPESCTAQLVSKPTQASLSLFQFADALAHIAKELLPYRNARFSPPQSTLSLTLAEMKGGKLEITFDVRTTPEVKTNTLQKRLESAITAARGEIRYREINPPLQGRKQSPLLNRAALALKQSGVKKVGRKTKASSTEAAIYQSHGTQALVFGPGISVGNVHRPNEYNLLNHLEIATRFYEKMMRIEI